MPARRTGLAAVATAATLAAAGCGGSVSKPTAPPSRSAQASVSSSGPALTRTQYIAKADALCRTAETTSPPFPGKRSGNGFLTTASLIVPYLDKVAAITATTLDGFRSLRPPASQSAGAGTLIAAQQARLDDLHQALAAAASHDGAGFTAAFQRDQRQDGPRYVSAAAKLGLRTCAAGH